MSLHTALLSSEPAQLLFVSGLVVAAVAIGQTLYRRADQSASRVEQIIENRKHPDIRYVLYDMFWAPAILLIVILLIRGGVTILPPGSVTQSLLTVLDVLLVLILLWTAVRVVLEVFHLVQRESQEKEEEVNKA